MTPQQQKQRHEAQAKNFLRLVEACKMNDAVLLFMDNSGMAGLLTAGSKKDAFVQAIHKAIKAGLEDRAAKGNGVIVVADHSFDQGEEIKITIVDPTDN